MVILGPGEDTWLVPAAQTKSRVARDYTRMGIAHIWAGADHLLFLVCLIWIAGGLRRILVTITGFTLAHSVTLALSALDLVRLPVPPIEAAIALSVMFLATEIAKNNHKTLTWRYPIAVSSSFGLLHGFGFAAVLNDIGLPQTEVVTGLLFFNIGVEIGQILFAGGVVLGLRLIGRYTHDFRMKPKNQRFFRRGVAYAVGSFASFWLVQRTMAFLG